MEGNEQRTRTGVMHLKARLSAAERELARVTKERDAHEANAAKLAKFIQDRVGTNVWAHPDVMMLVHFLHVSVLRQLRRQCDKAAASGTPASHVLYRRMIEKTYSEAVAELVRDFPQHAQRFDLIRQEMLTALEAAIIDKDEG